MMIDAQQVKDRISLQELFERDGHDLHRMGSSFVCYCPFHEERTRSCHVHEAESYFKCFGCGAGGDCYTYWEKSRGTDFAQALRDLAAIAGVTSGAAPAAAANRPARRKVEAEKPAARLEGAALEAWLGAVERLREDPKRQAKIAAWRGYALETVAWAVSRGLLGLIPMMGQWREAFLVERPEGEGMVPVGYHVRLAPGSAGNPGEKASWRYVPTGIGAWPFVIGRVDRARVAFCLEGQWDALALCDAMSWGLGLPEGVAIVGMRGATSWKRFLQAYRWREETTFFALSDSDRAGRGWFGEGGFVEELRGRCKRVWGFWPATSAGKDFNDVWRDRVISGDELKELLRAKMRRPVVRKHGPTFLQFCRTQKWREDEVGRAARIVCSEEKRPLGRKPWKVWERFLERHVPGAEERAACRLAWSEWKSSSVSQLKAQEKAWAQLKGA